MAQHTRNAVRHREFRHWEVWVRAGSDRAGLTVTLVLGSVLCAASAPHNSAPT